MAEKENKKTENHIPKLDPNDRIKGKKEENIFEMPNGRYMVIVQKRIGGKVKTKKKRNVKLIQEARQIKKKFIYELGEDHMRHKDGKRKWKVAYERYLADIRQRIDEGRKEAEEAGEKIPGEGPYETAKAVINYTKHWDRLYLTEISQSHVHSMINMSAFKALSYGQKKHLMRHIRNAFKFNLGPVGGIFLNPAHGVYVRRDKNEEPHQAIWIRPDVMAKIFDKLFDEDMNPKGGNKMAVPIYTAYYTGLRSGELYALEWKDVHLKDPHNSYFHVNATYNWKLKRLTPTKSGQDRDVDVTAIKDFLLRHKVRSTEKQYVFPRDKEWEKGKMARAFRNILKEVGYEPEINKKGLELWPRFHDLRASYIMNLLTADGGAVAHVVVQQMAGHASWDTTANYVSKLKNEDTKGTSLKLKPYKKSRKTG